jgi:hypothetical protein
MIRRSPAAADARCARDPAGSVHPERDRARRRELRLGSLDQLAKTLRFFPTLAKRLGQLLFFTEISRRGDSKRFPFVSPGRGAQP